MSLPIITQATIDMSYPVTNFSPNYSGSFKHFESLTVMSKLIFF